MPGRAGVTTPNFTVDKTSIFLKFQFCYTVNKYFCIFIYSEKATKFCEISTVDLSYVVPVKSTCIQGPMFILFVKFSITYVGQYTKQYTSKKF